MNPTERLSANDVLMALRGRLFSLQLTLSDFNSLFRDERAVSLLNDVAPSFFARVQKMIIRDAVLAVCAMTDPPEYRGKARLSIRTLAKLGGDRTELNGKETSEAVSTLRNLRNEYLAHFDLEAAFGKEPSALLCDIEQSVDFLQSWLRRFERDLNSQGPSEAVDQGTWMGADSLVSHLHYCSSLYTSYQHLLDVAASSEDARSIDSRLTESTPWGEYGEFSQYEWRTIKKKAVERGIASVLRDLVVDDSISSLYVRILDFARNGDEAQLQLLRDRRAAALIRREGGSLRSLLKNATQRAGER